MAICSATYLFCIQFFTGALTKFVVTFPKSKGNIKKISLWHDHSGETPDWRVDYVTIRDVTLDQKYHFTCYDWIAIGKGKQSHVWERTPALEKPSIHQEIAFKLNASLCNFSRLGVLFRHYKVVIVLVGCNKLGVIISVSSCKLLE